MNQIFAHRAPQTASLLHDLPPPDWFYRHYRNHGLKPKRRSLVGKSAPQMSDSPIHARSAAAASTSRVIVHGSVN